MYQPQVGDRVHHCPLQVYASPETYVVLSSPDNESAAIYSDDFGMAVVNLEGVDGPVSVLTVEKAQA